MSPFWKSKKKAEDEDEEEDESGLSTDQMVDVRKNRYKDDTSIKQYETICKWVKKNTQDMIDHFLDEMAKSPNRPKNMKYFDEMAQIYKSRRVQELIDHKAKGGKVLGTFCMFVPFELVYAANAIPVRLCSGIHGSVSTGDEVMVDAGLCPLVKSVVGSTMIGASPYIEQCDTLVNPMVCDAKLKMGEVLADYFRVWMLNVPHIKDTPQAKELWLHEMETLKKNIEELTGNKIYWEELKDAIEMFLKTNAAFRRFYDLRKADKPAITGRDAMLVSQIAFFDDIPRWTKRLKDLSNEVEDRIKKGVSVCDPDAPRILLAGAPVVWPNWKIPQIIEESGGIIVADELCSGMRSLYDSIGVDEWNWDDMFRALSEKYLLPCCCPCFTPNDERVERILQMAEDFNVEGVFYHVLRGCHVYNIESTRLKIALHKRKDIPLLIIETEYSLEDIEQIRTRVEAFLMLVKSRRKKEVKK